MTKVCSYCGSTEVLVTSRSYKSRPWWKLWAKPERVLRACKKTECLLDLGCVYTKNPKDI